MKQKVLYLESVPVRKSARAARQSIKDILMQKNSRQWNKSTTKCLAYHLNIRPTDSFLLPGMHGSSFAHTAHNLVELSVSRVRRVVYRKSLLRLELREYHAYHTALSRQ